MNIRTITTISCAFLVLGSAGPAIAADHIYTGAMCKQEDGGTSLHTVSNTNTAANMHTTNDANVTCPVVNLDPTAHDVCVIVQAWDNHLGGLLVDNVHCRITWRTTGSLSQGSVGTYPDLGVGRFDFEVEQSLPANAAYALHCTVPDMEAAPSSIETYSVSDSAC